jgi:hypothetical protein
MGICTMRRRQLIVISMIVLFLSDVLPHLAMCGEKRIPESSRLTLRTDANLSASVRIADIDSDNDFDVIVANGRQRSVYFHRAGNVRPLRKTVDRQPV